MDFLCDTNIISEVMKRSPNPDVKSWLQQHNLIYISVITLEEIYWGLAYKDARRQREWFERFVKYRCDVLPVTHSMAKRCGELRGQFRKRGVTKKQADTLIAATAYTHHLIAATRNTQDFEDCGIDLFNPFTGEYTRNPS